jgi:hypothetical protein
VTFGANPAGEEAYRVYLIFPDDTPENNLSWAKIKPMVTWVQDQIWKANGEQRWPYVRVKRESDR